MRVLVLGGAGFIGRHAAAALAARGHAVVIGTRRPRRRLPRLVLGYEVLETHLERLATRGEWHVLLAGFHAVVNAVGILRNRGAETYERVHHVAPAALAAACALAGRRLIHVSALGLSPDARSGFITSKLAGERAVIASGADYSIVRPSLLEGPGGFGARWLEIIGRLPIHFIPADAVGRIAVMDVRDLGTAIADLCERRGEHCREVELGGETPLTMAGYLAKIRSRNGAAPALQLRVPAWLARIVSHACDLVHFSPFSFGHLELMRRDNVPRPGLFLRRIPELVEPAPVALRRPAFQGGRRFGAPAA